MISVIIPAYKAAKYIHQCLDSIQGAEILVGVDGNCQETLDSLHFYVRKNVKIYTFSDINGPFVIKNTLVDEASNDHILFFDSDDVLTEGVIERIDERLAENQYVKLNYINFYNKPTTTGHIMNDAVVAIKRSIFNSINGFQPWKCAADTELAYRLQHNNLKYSVLDGLAYHRRLHGENLTMKADTGHKSPIREKYVAYINEHIKLNSWPNPQTKTTASYVTY